LLSDTRLRDQFKGRVITPGDSDYDAARKIFNGSYNQRPAVIIRPADAIEVSRVIGLARDSGATLAIRSGGHSGAGHGSCDEGIMLDLSGMQALDLDVAGRTAWAQTGLTTGAYTAAAASHGLATGFGDTPGVGIGGITLGGGVGYLVRKHGLTIDDLLAAEIVTADGRVLHVDADSHPDLFWAIRGGGGNFGVATKFKFRLHALPSVVGGMLLLPASADVIAAFVHEAEQAPEELSAVAAVMKAPPMPSIPAEHHGKRVVMAMMVYAGDTEAGQRAFAPFRALATPLVDTIGEKSYAAMFPQEPEFHPVVTGRTLYVDAIDRTKAQTILDAIEASTAQVAVTQFRVLGGAVARVPVEATAYAHRNERILVHVAALYGHPDEAPPHEEWVLRTMSSLNPRPNAAYVNFLSAEGDVRVRDAYPPATWERLRQVKQQYDPSNLFRRNQNVVPAS
jgi:FAD/FMN-containing dehydrogenase